MNDRALPNEPPTDAEPTLEVLVRDATKLFASWWLGDCGPCFLRVENARGEEETLLPLREQRAWKFLTVREPGTLYALSLSFPFSLAKSSSLTRVITLKDSA